MSGTVPVERVPPQSVLGYAEALIGRLVTVSAGRVQAAYLHGSAVLGGWLPASDVDLLVITADGTSAGMLGRLAEALTGPRQACPGRGLECSVVTRSAAGEPGPPWPYLLHVVTGPQEPGGSRVILGADSGGDADLLMHYAVCRAAGWPVCGPPPDQIIGAVSRQRILAYLAGELRFGLEHGTEAYAVLNACRALVYRADGLIVSKLGGGESALRRGLGPAELIRSALAQQRGQAAQRSPGADAAAFVQAAAALLGDTNR
jgi:hypothetical protein